jgi:hypothetical protein
MPFNGSGTFNRLHSWVTDANNGINISAPEMDADTNDIAAGLSNCLTKDGQQAWGANQNANSQKLTNLALATAATDAAQLGQITGVTTGSAFRKNWLLNGAMLVDQRNERNTVTATAARAYMADGWQIARSANTAQGTSFSGTGLLNLNYACQAGRQAGDTNLQAIQFAQSLTTIDSYPLQGLTVTLSFWAKAGTTFSASGLAMNASLFYGTGTDQNVIAGYTGSSTAINANPVLSTSLWQRFSYTSSISLNATEVGVIFSYVPTGTAGATDYFQITGVQLAVEPAATDYDHIPIQAVLTRCQRDCFKTFPVGTKPAQNATAVGAWQFIATKAGAVANFGPSLYWPVVMRAAPSVTFYNPSAANAQARDIDAGADCSSTAGSIDQLRYVATVTANAGTAVGNRINVHILADAAIA